MKLVYVAGPFSPTQAQKDARLPDDGRDAQAFHRACVAVNIRKAELLGVEVAKLGCMPIIPHANTQLPAFEEVQPYTFWIEGTRLQLLTCEAVLFTPDWEQSSGARGEHETAKQHGIPCFFDLEELKRWLDS